MVVNCQWPKAKQPPQASLLSCMKCRWIDGVGSANEVRQAFRSSHFHPACLAPAIWFALPARQNPLPTRVTRA